MNSTKSLGALYAELGRGLFEAQRYEDAADALRKALAEKAADFSLPDTYLIQGRVYKALNKNPEALDAFEKALELDPNKFENAEADIIAVRNQIVGTPGADSAGEGGGLAGFIKGFLPRWLSRTLPLRKMAFSLMENQKFAEAESLLRLLAVASDDAEVQEKLGWAQLKQGKVSESVESFKKAVSLEKGLASAHQGLGEAYQTLGRSKEASEALQRALDLKPDDPAVLFLHGVVLRKLGELDSSEKTLRRLVELQPENDKAYCEIAATLKTGHRNSEAAIALTKATSLLLKKADYIQAERLGEQAVKLDDSSGPAYLELGRARIGQKRYDDALISLKEAATRNLTVQAYTEIARALFHQENFPSALEAIDQALGAIDQASIPSPEFVEATGLKGVILFRLKRREEATLMLDEALSHDPKNAFFGVERGAIFQEMNQPDQAILAFQRAIEADPNNRWAYKRIGLLLFEEQRYEEAADYLQHAVEFSPEVLLIAKRGEALHHIGRDEEAIPVFEEALRLDPTNSDASYYRGQALSSLERYPEAVSAFLLAIDLNLAQGRDEHDLADIYGEMGEALRLSNRLHEAKAAFKKAISLKDGYQLALARYGETLRNLDKYEEAVSYLQKATSLDPKDGWALARLGEAFRDLERYEEAVDYLQKATTLDPKDGWAWGALGAARLDLHQYRSALQALEQAVALDSRTAFNWGQMGVLLRLVERLDKAIEAFNRALELEADVAWILVEKGMALREVDEAGRHQALPLLERGTQLDPETGNTWCQLAVCLYWLDRYPDALETVDKGIALDPSLSWALVLKSLVLERLERTDESQQARDSALPAPADAKAYFARGSNYMELAAYDKAVADFDKALELDPNYADALNNLAWVCLISPTPDFEKATEHAQRAAGLAPNDGNIKDTLGWACYKRGMIEEASVQLEEAAKLSPEDLAIQDHLDECRKAAAHRASA